jgi:cytochrome P450
MTTPEMTAARLPWDAADPYPFYEARRREGSVVWDHTAHAWLVLGHEAAREVLAGPDWISDPRASPAASEAIRLLTPQFVEASMLFTDGLPHVRLRGAVRDVFTRSFINGLAKGVESICAHTTSTVDAGDDVDVMSQIVLPLPIAVIGTWLGLDSTQCAALREHSPSIIRVLGGFADQHELEVGLEASAALIADFLPAAADRRTQPGDDLLSFLAADPNLSLDEVVVTAILIAVAGHETTANLLGANLIRLLTPAPDGTRPADRIDPNDPGVITELLRLDSPVQAAGRTATKGHTLDGVDIACGDAVLVCIAAANRDPHVYDRPDEFQPDRTGPTPLTFGHGAHYCLGAALARLETSAALRHILARRPVLTGAPTWRDTPAIRGPLTVPARFTT